MTPLALAGWVADGAILASYAAFVARGKEMPFHWANALGGPVLGAIEVATHAWQVLPLTVTFTVLGWVGVFNRKEEADG